MKRSLGWHDLICFGVGGMVGAGVFITTLRASRLCAGPAVVLSYAIAGLCAILSTFCYTKFAVAMPVAGGSFSYIRVTFGELPAFFTGSNLIVDYVLSNAAVTRGLTSYLGTALGLPADAQLRFTIHSLPRGYNEIDLIAVVVVLLVTIVICYSTKQSSWVNMSLTALHILFIAFVIAMGFWRGKLVNFTEPSDPKSAGGFFPFGASGMFNRAAVVYMSYIGYDAVSTMAEEVENPARNIPIGVTGFGIVTSLLVAMLGQARYMCVIRRSCVVPSWFAQVHRSNATPLNASCLLGVLTAAITDLDILLDLVSIGTLFVFYMVANAVIYRRYVAIGTMNPWPTLSFLLCFSLTCIRKAQARDARSLCCSLAGVGSSGREARELGGPLGSPPYPCFSDSATSQLSRCSYTRSTACIPALKRPRKPYKGIYVHIP
ncbi:hypothetical protein SASPL_105819 [Salvia splendens]|uniref:Basic amino acid/polyamine antiporter, APA family n=1 Tax=Salvia splendens TaxID=180675 RepID=A0A8X8YPC7_SALSN|nr:hypothetical protein SASPL_105819 [Salvia splendens]